MKQFPTCGLLIKISVVVGLNRQFFNPGEGKNTPSNQIPKSSKVFGEKSGLFRPASSEFQILSPLLIYEVETPQFWVSS